MSRRRFATTWWGQAWVDALEQRARLDPNRLPRGRTYARQERVGELTVEPGQVSALVRGSRATPYHVLVRVREFTDAEWHTVLDAIAARAAHAAALLDGELPPAVLDDVHTAGIDLLPGPGEIGPRCSCPDWADPCKHAAAVCYLMADVLDHDPFELFHVRGRNRDAVLAALRARRASASGGRSAAPPRERGSDSVEARVAYARSPSTAGDLWSLAALPPLAKAGRPAPLPLEAPAASGISIEGLTDLATDAAQRAWELTTGSGNGGLALDAEHDLARRAASRLGTPEFGTLATRAGVTPRRLVSRALAWRAGGAEGLDVLTASWAPDDEALDDARDALRATGARPRVSENRVTAGPIQLRLGRSGLWYRFDKRGAEWELVVPPHPDPPRTARAHGERAVDLDRAEVDVVALRYPDRTLGAGARLAAPSPIRQMGEGRVLVAAEEVRARLRRRLVEEYGVDEADMLLDPPPGGWGEVVTRDWLQLELDARFAPVHEKFASIDRRFDSIESRLTTIESEIRAQTWKLVAAMTGLFAAFVAAIKL